MLNQLNSEVAEATLVRKLNRIQDRLISLVIGITTVVLVFVGTGVIFLLAENTFNGSLPVPVALLIWGVLLVMAAMVLHLIWKRFILVRRLRTAGYFELSDSAAVASFLEQNPLLAHGLFRLEAERM